MFKTITATYASKATVANVVEELVNDGIPREKIEGMITHAAH